MNGKMIDIEYLKKRWPIAKNFVCAVLASTLSNFVLQFFLYPAIEHRVGEARYGEILVFITIANVCGLSFGGAANATCLTSRKHYQTEPGDFFAILMCICLAAAAVSLVLVRQYLTSAAEAVCLVMLIVLTVYQSYSFLEYQLRKNYTGYLIYILLIAAAEIACLPLFQKTGNWALLLLPGMVLGLLYVRKTGRIYRRLGVHSTNMGRAAGDTLVLSSANLLNYGAQNADRFLLLPLIGGTAVTYYYVASLFSKTLSMVSGPVNNLILGYLSDKKKPLDRKVYLQINILVLTIVAVFLTGVVLLGPWLLELPFLYPDLIGAVRPYILPASLAQLLVIGSSIIVTIDLIVAPNRLQITLQGIYVIAYVALSVPLTLRNGLQGFVAASCIAAAMRYMVSFLIGWKYIKPDTEGPQT